MTKSGSLDLDFDFDRDTFSLATARVDDPARTRTHTSFLLPSTPGPGDGPSVMMASAAGTASHGTNINANTMAAANYRHGVAADHRTYNTGSDTTDTTSNSNITPMTTSTTSTATTTATSSTAPTIVGSTTASATSSTTALHRHTLQPGRRQKSMQQLRRRNSKDGGVGHGLNGSDSGNNEGPLRSRRHRYHNSLRLLDNYFWPDHRPASSRSHIRYWHRSKSPVPNASQYLRASTDGAVPTFESLPSMTMSKGEFETLPPTIQRKYFSTLERLRFAQDPDCADHPDLDPAKDSARDYFDQLFSESTPEPDQNTPNGHRHRPSLQPRFATDPLSTAPHRRRIANPTLDRIYSTPGGISKGRSLSSDGKLVVKRQRKSVILDATDESLIKIGRRQPQPLSADGQLDTSDCTETEPFGMHAVQSSQMMGPELKATADSMYDSFRWLEEDEDLDLRLFLDDYHFNLREDVPAPSKSRHPSFRRHMSISKLPFGRPSTTLGRTETREATASPTFMGPPTVSVPNSPGPNGHGRRRSRALSLISPNKQPLPDISTVVDPSAAHYQDPEARMKLRVYLASAHKFDEAIEFGFPSIDEVQDKENCPPKRSESRQAPANSSDKLRSFLEDDKSSMYTDEASATEPDTPKTPQDTETFDTMETPVAHVQPTRTSHDRATAPKGDYAQASASSREMTLRMTLTRPDLRALDEQIYGWQKPAVARKSHTRDESAPPAVYTRDANSKSSIEKQFAAFDQENFIANGDSGVVKRFWNRVRRS